jgi:hypothetical protein
MSAAQFMIGVSKGQVQSDAGTRKRRSFFLQQMLPALRAMTYLGSQLTQIVEAVDAPTTRLASGLQYPDVVRSIYLMLRCFVAQLDQRINNLQQQCTMTPWSLA